MAYNKKVKKYRILTGLCMIVVTTVITAGGGGINTVKAEGINRPGSNEPVNNELAGDTSDFVIKDGSLIEYNGEGKEVNVPEGVTKISNTAFQNRNDIVKIVLPEGVAVIDHWAFMGCTKLEEITLPDSLTEIGTQAFMSCISLVSITIPKGVEAIGSRVFDYCGKLEDITILSDCMLDINMFSGTKWLADREAEDKDIIVNGILLKQNISMSEAAKHDILIPEGVKRIGSFAFNRSSIKGVIIPDEVTEIGDYAFADCNRLQNVVFGTGLKIIGTSAFSGCYKLTSLLLPDSVEHIGDMAFRFCGELESITLPSGLKRIGIFTFENCRSLNNIKLPELLKAIESGAFYGCSKLTRISIPSTVSEVGRLAFYGTPWLKNRQTDDPMVIVNSILIDGTLCKGKTVIPKDVKTINEEAFQASGITSIVIPDGVTEIRDNTFAYCSSLKSVTMPDSITHIGDMAFAECISLTKIDIPGNCRTIGMQAFSNCTKLKSVRMNNKAEQIGAKTFVNCEALEEADFPDTVEKVGNLALYGTKWLKQKQDKDGMVIIGSVLYDASGCSNDVVVPEGITGISAYAFNCKNPVYSVTVPDSVKYIDTNAFFGCKDLITLIASGDSYAAAYAVSNNMRFSESGQRIVEDIKVSKNKSKKSGRAVIEDKAYGMLYYKEGICSSYDKDNLVNLVALDIEGGTKKTIARVGNGPIYMYGNYILYTNSEGLFRIDKDGKNNTRLVKAPANPSEEEIYYSDMEIIGATQFYVYYIRKIFSDSGHVCYISRIKVNGKDNMPITSYTMKNHLDMPLLANNRIYYVSYAGWGICSLETVSLDGSETDILVKDAYNISGFLADSDGVYYTCQNTEEDNVSIIRISSGGAVKKLAGREPDYYFGIRLCSLYDGYIYYASNNSIYRISTGGGTPEDIFNINSLGKVPGEIYKVLVRGNWMILYFDGDDSPGAAYAVRLDGSEVLNLGRYCYRDSFDISSGAIYYRVVTIPGDDGDESLNGRETVYRRLEVPIVRYEP